MLRLVANNVARIRASRKQLLVIPKASYIRGFWPEPITQQTLDQFLKDINYFDEPKELVNIGLQLSTTSQKSEKQEKKRKRNQAEQNVKSSPAPKSTTEASLEPEKVDEVLDFLSKESSILELDEDDISLTGDHITPLAIRYGIYRDLFRQSPYVPERDDISFTTEQAERMNRLIPHFWITDQPFARVKRKVKHPDSLHYFDPIIGISARFVNETRENNVQNADMSEGEDTISSHRSYYGNIIPACEAQQKPSMTLDGKLLCPENDSTCLNEKDFDNWTPGSVSLANFRDSPAESKYHSIILLNLDPPLQDGTILHYMLTNIKPGSSDGDNTPASGEETCEYLPVFGVRGFGYSRYVFVAFQHDSMLDTTKLKVEKYALESRKFDVRSFMEQNRSTNIIPVGLSWFQATWDESSNRVFHDYLNARAPQYEYLHPQETKQETKPYPGKIPFNVFLDYSRDKKEINEQVLMERLKITDPFEGYKDQYVPPKVPETVFEDKGIPSWMHSVMFKKKNKLGYWRGLRPASALLPLDNNADLDTPLRPRESTDRIPPEFPNEYPGKPKYKKHKDMPTSRPVNEFQDTFIQENHNIDMKLVKNIAANAGDPQKTSKSVSKKQKS